MAQSFSDWSAPVNLGVIVNSGLNNQQPAISKDGLRLYYSSDRSGTMGGLDLWVSQRASPTAAWGTPHNLGTNINSGVRDLAMAPRSHVGSTRGVRQAEPLYEHAGETLGLTREREYQAQNRKSTLTGVGI